MLQGVSCIGVLDGMLFCQGSRGALFDVDFVNRMQRMVSRLLRKTELYELSTADDDFFLLRDDVETQSNAAACLVITISVQPRKC